MKKLNSLEIGICAILVLGVLGFVYASDISLTLGKKLIVEWLIIAILIFKLIKNKILKTYLLYCLIISLPITPMRYNQWSFLTLWTILLYTIYFVTVSENFNIKRINWILNTLCVVAFVNACWTVMQYFGVWHIVVPSMWHGGEGLYLEKGYEAMTPNLSGLLGKSNVAGVFYGITLVAFFRKDWCKCLPFVRFGLWQTNSYMWYVRT